MIRNERQYRITKAQLHEFERQLASPRGTPPPDIHPRIVQAQREAMQSQVDELREDLASYDALQSGRATVLDVSSLDELPAALIQARIASGMTQRELASRLGMKEQQLQRYEATDYAGATLARIREVVAALGVRVREELFLPNADVSSAHVLRRAQSAGLAKDFMQKRILRSRGAAIESDDAVALRGASLLNRIFGWAPAALFGDADLLIGGAAAAGIRLKLPTNAATRATEAYASYAHYLAGLMLRATPTLTPQLVPTDPAIVRRAILDRGDVSLAATLDYIWSLGIPVLPLSDLGAFHGATWRMSGRNVIVIKQSTRLESRWTHDALHELRHAGEDPDAREFSFLDYESLARDEASSADETAASMFAGDVLLDGRAEELAARCIAEGGRRIWRLKAVVPRVAQREGVPVGALANYLAFRLSLQGESWWGPANNLQIFGSADPWLTARDIALSRVDLSRLDDVERGVLLQALQGA